MSDKLDTQEFYEVMQQYRHSNANNQEQVVKSFENVKTWIRDNFLGEVEKKVEGCPEWLTSDVRKLVKETWDSHKVCNDGLTIKAMRIVQATAKEAGYEIGISKAMDLMKEYCNIYD